MSLVGVCPDNRANTMNWGVFMMYPVYALLLTFSMELRQNLIYNFHTLVKFQPVAWDEKSTIAQGEQPECNGTGAIRVPPSKIVYLQNYFPLTQFQSLMSRRWERWIWWYDQFWIASNCANIRDLRWLCWAVLVGGLCRFWFHMFFLLSREMTCRCAAWYSDGLYIYFVSCYSKADLQKPLRP